MKIGYLLCVISGYFILQGLWKLYCIKMYKQAYRLFKKPNEEFLDFLNREVNTWGINLAVILGLHKYYNSKLYTIIQILLGLLQVLFGVFILIFIFYISKTDFKLYFDIEI